MRNLLNDQTYTIYNTNMKEKSEELFKYKTEDRSEVSTANVERTEASLPV